MRPFVTFVFASAAMLALTVASSMGQGTPVDKSKLMKKNAQSPPMETSVTINGKQIWIVYHAPSVRGRKIFGGADALQPDDTIWRLGADYATVLHTEGELNFNGLTVPPGEYSLYVALDKGKWQLIVNKQTGQWGITMAGATTDDPSKDLGRIPLEMSKPSSPVEQLKIALSSPGGNKGKLNIAWENVEASAPFTVK
ncbi:MAG TPA: DUF2911 domain-containing protein [Bryobacteraceae bacterium]|nr:DUF2911 domain-containing protein [Bryobacteraceae bacterium]